MKNTVLIGVLCLIIGAAAGWFAKPNTTPAEAVVGASPEPASSSSGAGVVMPSSGIRSESPSKAGARPAKADPPESASQSHRVVIDGADAKAMQDRWHKQMIEQTKHKAERKVAELARKLGLDANQTAKLQAYFDDKLAALAGGGEDDFRGMRELGKLLKQDSVDAALADILSDEQALAYEEMKTNEHNRKVESRALKDLAKINTVLDLSQDQKDAVYDILYEDAGKKVDANRDTGAFMALSMNGEGIDIDLEDLGLTGVDGTLEIPNPEDGGKVDWKKAMQERNQRRIDQQVERVAPALTEEQTTQYREHLESKSGGLLGGVIDGAVGEVIDGAVGGAVGGAIIGEGISVESTVIEIAPGAEDE